MKCKANVGGASKNYKNDIMLFEDIRSKIDGIETEFKLIHTKFEEDL